jgi:hypothetical protein
LKRQKLWDACYAAGDRVSAALADYRQDKTPITRAQTQGAIREFIESLHPLIGRVATFRYEASWQAFEDAAARSEQLNAAIAAKPTIDAGDVELMEGLSRELVGAGEAVHREQVAIVTLVDSACERDEKGKHDG